ncbi:hypothetical protein [Novilysobacter arseniciresistens]|uniref:hypothetical protein n=1 Tax=Novilysobacter arseniciresistens TaxID=1385522 RepID=UPI00068AC4F6|nr:hypothetical protein [Lysobacter arseniciresistens]
MHHPERRKTPPSSAEQMRERLNPPQRSVLRLLEYFGWELRFVRQPPLHPPVPVIFAGDATWAVIAPDGKVDDSTRLRVRHPGFERRQRPPAGQDVGSDQRPSSV